MKIIRTRDEEILENMSNEFGHLKSVKCENVIQVKDLFQEKSSGIVYLVMEFFKGKEMFEYIAEMGKYCEKNAKFLFK